MRGMEFNMIERRLGVKKIKLAVTGVFMAMAIAAYPTHSSDNRSACSTTNFTAASCMSGG